MIRLSFDRDEAISALTRIISKTMQMDEPWDWPCGVAFAGVSEAYRLTGDKGILEALSARVDELIELGLPPWTVNTCAMGHCLLVLYEATGDERYNAVLREAITYLREKALRFGEGTLQHTVSANNDFPEQAWADTLFMAAFLMLKTGVRDNDKELIEDALNQFAAHAAYLQDPATGLWKHGYDNVNKNHMSGFHWARANAWAAATMSQVGRILPQPYLYPQYIDISCSLRDHLSALKRLQTENGLWHTVLDDEGSYEELSASCGIACAMLANGNPLHSKAAQRAYDAIMGNISPDGRLLNVSGGTAVMRDLEGYRKIPKRWAQGWGQGLALLFLAEALRPGKG
jgi:unsaturated rhamnogalacturonyl hydrolase